MNTNDEALNKVIDTLKDNFIKAQTENQNNINEMINSLELIELIYNSIPDKNS